MMKSIGNNKKNAVVVLAASALVLLPGCDWFKDKMGGVRPITQGQQSIMQPEDEFVNDTSEVLVSIGGKPLITRNKLDKEKNELVESNPQLKAVARAMAPEALDLNILQGLISQAVVDQYISDRGIDKRAEYQQELDRTMRSVRHMLNTKYFTQEFPVTINEEEAREFYEQNKDVIPDLLISRGGVKTAYASFDNKDDADAFLAQIESRQGDVKKAAEDMKLGDKFKDFTLVHQNSLGLEPALREHVLEVAEFPATQIYPVNDDTFYVIYAESKEEPKYQPFARVQDGIRQYLERERRTQKYEDEINRLMDQYQISKSKSIEDALESLKTQMTEQQSAMQAISA